MNNWIQAARLRTLPLSLSGIIVGSAYAYHQGFYDYRILGLALLTTLGLQILSNFANDYGDGIKGTDNEKRVGPARALQSGILNAIALKRGMFILGFLVVLSVTALFMSAQLSIEELVVFVLLSLVALAAAIAYTVGERPYGYAGLGDLMVFLFFGGVAVLAGTYIYTKGLTYTQLWFAIAVGAFSTAVLNLNNMRDVVSDQEAAKNTVVVRLGYSKAIMYHHLLVIVAFFAFIAATARINPNATLVAIPMVLLLRAHLGRVRKAKQGTADLDPELKKVAMLCFMAALFILVFVLIREEL
jgi:1,4-dihydroxy-2-naphthoate polyprenyltransferase